MEPVYGIHLGLVVSDNPDPEGRNRIQVWVPHISNTLFTSINSKLSDPNFNGGKDLNIKDPSDLDKIDSNIVKKLRMTLPWAEYGAPLFGGSSGNYNHAVGNTSTTNTPPFPDNSYIAPPSIPSTNATASYEGVKQLETSSNPLGGGGVTKSLNVPSNLSNDSEFQSVLAGYIQQYPGLTADQIYAIMQGESGYNTNTRTGSYVGLFQLKPGEGGAPDSASIMSASPAQQLNWYMNYLSSSGYNGSQPVALYQAAPGYMQQGHTNSGDSMSDPNTVIFSAGSIEANSNPGWRDSNGNVTVASVQNYYYGSGNSVADNTNSQQNNITASGPRANPYTSRSSAQGTPANIGTAGSAVGTFTTPNAGSKVWVFFIGGDIQRPVYFAQAVNKGDVKAATG